MGAVCPPSGGGGGGGSSSPSIPSSIGLSWTLVSMTAATSGGNLQVSTPSTPAYTATTTLNDGVVLKTYSDGAPFWGSGTPAIVCDLGSAKTVTTIYLYGATNSGVGIAKPAAILAEYSDNNSSYTTLENRTGLTVGSGIEEWKASFDPSALAAHRYWRFTLTASSGASLSQIVFIP